MADAANTTTTDSGNENGANLAQVIAQVAAGLAAVTTTVNEITAKLNSISENVKKTAESDDRGFDSALVGSYNPFSSLLKSDESRDRISAYAELALANAIKAADGLATRSLDHFGSLPPVNKPTTGC